MGKTTVIDRLGSIVDTAHQHGLLVEVVTPGTERRAAAQRAFDAKVAGTRVVVVLVGTCLADSELVLRGFSSISFANGAAAPTPNDERQLCRLERFAEGQ